MDKLLILILITDTTSIYRLPEEKILATQENFRREWDLSSIVRPGYYSSLPVPFGSMTRVLFLTGGVGPADYGFSVRGGAFWENRVILNGTPLPDPIFHIIIMAPVEQEVVRYAVLHRSALPIRYQGTSSVLEIETDRLKRFFKAGFPSASGQITYDGFYVYSYGEWIPGDEYASASIMAGYGMVDAIAYARRFPAFKVTPRDTFDLSLTQAQAGFSIKPVGSLHASFSIHYINILDRRRKESADGYMGMGNLGWRWKMIGCQVEFINRWGLISEAGGAFSKMGYMAGCYAGRRSGVRLDVINGQAKLSARLFKKFFMGERTAFKFYLGNGHQILYVYPLLLEPLILRRATTVYTAIAGVERLMGHGYADMDFYLKYYNPYTATDSAMEKYSMGMDFTIALERIQASGFVQKGNIPGTARWMFNFAQFDRQGRGGVLVGLRDGLLDEDGERSRPVGYAGISRTYRVGSIVLNLGLVYYVRLPFGGSSQFFAYDGTFLLPVIWVKGYF